jgi:drug/metabolite transporter (DMT)-like permease
MRLPAANVFALLTGALIWGLVWYPYRFLRESGLAAAWATVFTYGFAWLVIGLVYQRRVRAVGASRWLLLVGVAAGCANVGFLIAAIYGQVARVVLLFYIAPVWTVPFAWMLLAEKPSRTTLATMLLALAGAVVMLWNPALGLPWPRDWAEWLGLASGVTFALANVLIRKTGDVDTGVRSFYIFGGCVIVGLGAALGLGQPFSMPEQALVTAVLVLLVGVVMLLCNWIVQYGLARTPSNLAIVIYLSELVFAALGGWWLAGEALGPKELAGGAIVMAASLLSAWLGRERA